MTRSEVLEAVTPSDLARLSGVWVAEQAAMHFGDRSTSTVITRTGAIYAEHPESEDEDGNMVASSMRLIFTGTVGLNLGRKYTLPGLRDKQAVAVRNMLIRA